MSVLFFCGLDNGFRKRLQRVIELQVPITEIEIYQTIQSLSDRLYQPKHDLAVMILVAATQDDLLDLISLKHLYNNIPIILVLPDREGKTLSMGLKLHPRYISDIDSDFNDLSKVLDKIRIKP